MTNDPTIQLNTKTGISTLIRSRMRNDYECIEYDGTFFDFLELFIQYGQVTLFVSVFPLGAVLAFINNVFEQRTDAFKILYELNPSKPTPSSGIMSAMSSSTASSSSGGGSGGGGGGGGGSGSGNGIPHSNFNNDSATQSANHSKSNDESYQIIDVWIRAFNMISYLAVATNIGLLAIDHSDDIEYQSKLSFLSMPGMANNPIDTWSETILILFAIEHIMFIFKAWLSYLLEHDDKERTNSNPQKHFADAALQHHSLTSLLTKYDSQGSVEVRVKRCLVDVLDQDIHDNVISIVREQENRIQMAENQRDEAIAYVGEVVPADIIEKHLKKSLTPHKNKRKDN